jgi:hypothetical protein
MSHPRAECLDIVLERHEERGVAVSLLDAERHDPIVNA